MEAALAAARVVAASSPPQHDIVRLVLPPGSEFDRIMISEDISFGQRIRNYTVSIIIEDTNLLSSSSSTSTIVLVSNGTSVGRKRIHVFPKIYSTIASTIQEEEERQQQYQHLSESSKISTTVTVLMNITKSIATPQIKLLGLYGPCFPRRNDENNNDKDIIILSKTRTTSTISTTWSTYSAEWSFWKMYLIAACIHHIGRARRQQASTKRTVHYKTNTEVLRKIGWRYKHQEPNILKQLC